MPYYGSRALDRGDTHISERVTKADISYTDGVYLILSKKICKETQEHKTVQEWPLISKVNLQAILIHPERSLVSCEGYLTLDLLTTQHYVKY